MPLNLTTEIDNQNQSRPGDTPRAPAPLDSSRLKELYRRAGADDVGFVEIEREEIADQRDDILRCLPRTKTLISFVRRMNREPIRSTARSAANLEFHHSGDDVNETAREIVRALEAEGVRAVNPAMGFPMEMQRFPGKIWIVSHKPVAVAAGLGRMGIHRNVIHPKFGNFILLGTVLIDAEVSETTRPIDYNPCVECKLCVAACPVGAISPEGEFNFSSCYEHNYREFMGGFTDWVEQVADSPNARAYRDKVRDDESASMWQSLSYGANYKAAYCMAVCPAGEDVITPFLNERKLFLDDVVRPLQRKEETVYVVPGSDAEQHVAKRFPHKTAKRVNSSLRPGNVEQFLAGLPLVFQPNQSAGLDATYHFTFTGKEERKVTISIRHKTVAVLDGHVGTAELRVTADSEAWIGFIRKDRGLLGTLLLRRIRLQGSPKWLLKFGKCFPS